MTAKEEYEALLAAMSDDAKQDLNDIPLKDLPLDTFQLNSMLTTLPKITVEKHGNLLGKFVKLNTLLHATSPQIALDDSRRTKSEVALDLAKAACAELFTDQYGKAYAVIRVNSHTETIALQSQKFRSWIAKLYHDKKNRGTLSSEDLTAALNVLKAEAQFDGIQRHLDLRVASMPNEENALYYDLTNDKWECVRITKDGWSVQAAPVLFTRYANHRPQAYPAKDYPADILDQFMQLFNVSDEENRLLLKCYMISLFIPNIAKPALMLYGQQGSAKSTLQELIKMVVDPSLMKTLSFPKDTQELTQKLSHNYVAYFDNISEIPDWISNDLCKAVSGSGFSKRALYTDDDDVIYSFQRCIGFNGINLGATKADLLDRGVIIQLERIPKDRRKKDKAIWEQFERIRPHLLGFIMDTLAKVLQRQGEVVLQAPERMADFTECGELIARCIGYPENRFLVAYSKNIGLQTEEVLESNPVGAALMSAINDGAPCGDCESCTVKKFKHCSDRQKLTDWSGTAGDLLAILNRVAQELNITVNSRAWPKAPNALSRSINEVATNLKEIGIAVTRKQTAAKRIIEIRQISSQPSLSSFWNKQVQNERESASET